MAVFIANEIISRLATLSLFNSLNIKFISRNNRFKLTLFSFFWPAILYSEWNNFFCKRTFRVDRFFICNFEILDELIERERERLVWISKNECEDSYGQASGVSQAWGDKWNKIVTGRR